MTISVNVATRVIYVPQADLTSLGGGRYEHDINAFRLALKDWEDSDDGMDAPDTHVHGQESTLSGVTYARKLEVINGYTVEYENGTYQVNCVGANHNVGDVKVVNSVSLVIGNSAGLISVGGADPLSLIVEGSTTWRDAIRLILAAVQGDATGLESGAPVFRDLANTKDRITSTYVTGTRTVTSRDAS